MQVKNINQSNVSQQCVCHHRLMSEQNLHSKWFPHLTSCFKLHLLIQRKTVSSFIQKHSKSTNRTPGGKKVKAVSCAAAALLPFFFISYSLSCRLALYSAVVLESSSLRTEDMVRTADSHTDITKLPEENTRQVQPHTYCTTAQVIRLLCNSQYTTVCLSVKRFSLYIKCTYRVLFS